MIVGSLFTSDPWVAATLLAVGVVIVLAIVAIADTGETSPEHELHPMGEAYRCTCGETFPTREAGLDHVAQQRHVVDGPVEDHPHRGLPMR